VTVLHVELAVLIGLLVVSLVFAWYAVRAAGERFEARERAMDRHARAVAREPLSVLREAQDVLAQTEAVREDVRLLHARVDLHLGELRRG
jgi:hypothetical protein